MSGVGPRGGKEPVPPLTPSTSKEDGRDSLAITNEVPSKEKSKVNLADNGAWIATKPSKREAKLALFKKWEDERRASHPHLYDLGYSDREVRAMIMALQPRDPKSNSGGSRGSHAERGRGGHQARGRGDGQARGAGQHTPARSMAGRGGQAPNALHPPMAARSTSRDRGGIGRGVPAPATSTPGKRKHDATPSGVTPPAKRGSAPSVHFSGDRQSYVQAVKPRQNFPHMLHIYKGTSERCPVPEKTFADIAVKLRKRVLAYGQEEGHIILQTAFIRWARDAGLVACKNKETADWFKDEVSRIVIDGVSFRAWDETELAVLHQARMNMSGLDGIEPAEVIQMIKCFTPELKGRIELFRTEKSGKEQLIVFGIDDDMAASLAAKEDPWTVNLGTDQRRIQYSGKVALRERVQEKHPDALANRLDNVNVAGGDVMDVTNQDE
jgi:hypothetical protein